MTEKQTSNEFIKYTFNEEEKRNLAIEMAADVSALQNAEDEKKAAASDFKSRIDGLQAKVNRAAGKLNNGYEMTYMDCDVTYDSDRKLVYFYLPGAGTPCKERPMTNDELQTKIPGMAA